MAYILILDNHGNEVARFHHSDVGSAEWENALAQARAVDAQFSVLGSNLREDVPDR